MPSVPLNMAIRSLNEQRGADHILRALRVAALSSALVGVATIAWHWIDGLPYDAASGVWVAQAHDWSHGVLYRPLYGEDGFGGTRYMPLFFVLLGELLRAGTSLAAAAAGLTILSLTLLMGVITGLIRRMGADARLPLPCAMIILSSISIQLLGIGAKGDMLAAALNLGGLYFAIGATGESIERRTRMALPAAVLCWTLAFATKVTALSAPIAFCIWLIVRGERSSAVAVATAMIAMGASVVGIVNLASDGRMLAAFGAVASGGGDWWYALRAPWWFLRAAARDPFLFAIVLAGSLAAIARARRDPRDLAIILFGLTTATTVAIFATPGTDSNHLADLLACSIILLALEASVHAWTWSRRILYAFAFANVLTLVPGMPSVMHFLHRSGRPTHTGLMALREALGVARTSPVLSENPLVPIVLGSTPDVLDPFSLRVLASTDSRIAAAFQQRMKERLYGAVVLVDWTASDTATVGTAIARHGGEGITQFYGEMNFPPAFLETLNSGYRVAAVVHPFVLFERR